MTKTIVNVDIRPQQSSSYPIIIGKGLIEDLSMLIEKNSPAKKLLIVTNTTVFKFYGEQVKNSLDKKNYNYKFFIIQDGEKYKTTETLNQIWDFALENKLERKDALVALGGGVIGDITGFAASTYLRGIDFIQIPTTLLAQVDSSVGGKVAVNHPLGKNMLGAFYQPKIVIADIDTLKTLPERELKTGLAEVLKYGFIEKTCGIKTNDFLSFLKKNQKEIMTLQPEITAKTIEHCCKLKAGVVNQDEKEAGLRAILNFGHTIAHSIERCTNYTEFTHGEAVAIGIKGVLLLSFALGKIKKNYLDSSLELLADYALNYKIPEKITPKELVDGMMHDKKVISSRKRFVLPIDQAEVKIFDDINDEDILKALKLLY